MLSILSSLAVAAVVGPTILLGITPISVAAVVQAVIVQRQVLP
jgi:hypothetical protein